MDDDSLHALIEEMRRDFVVDWYPDGTGYEGPRAKVLYRLWHGEGPGMEGHMSLATPEHIAEFMARLATLRERLLKEATEIGWIVSPEYKFAPRLKAIAGGQPE